MKTIAICSSAYFYRHVVELEQKLQVLGYEVIIPKNARQMKESGDYDVSHYKTWFDDAADYDKKADFMRSHFAEEEKSDAILVVNDTKNGIEHYIGGNVLIEMAIAFYLNKKIFVLHDLPEDSTYIEEIKGMQPILLNGQLEKLRLDWFNGRESWVEGWRGSVLGQRSGA